MSTFSKTRGFTLIEVMISVLIFSIVMTVALGALLAMSQSDQRAQALKSVVDNLNFALDSMSRTIRTGYSYDCGGTHAGPHDCAPPSTAAELGLVPASGSAQVYYRFDTNQSVCGTQTIPGCISRSTDGLNWYPLTSPEVIITSLQFIVTGSTPGDTVQPKVTILISGNVNVPGITKSAFNLQTSITQRIYDQ